MSDDDDVFLSSGNGTFGDSILSSLSDSSSSDDGDDGMVAATAKIEHHSSPPPKKKRKRAADAAAAFEGITISFDVGSRNLAYCIIETLPPSPFGDSSCVGGRILVHEWTTVDILAASGCKQKVNKVPSEKLIHYMCGVLSTHFSAERMYALTNNADGHSSHRRRRMRVLVERQVKTSTKNMMLSATILSFFLALECTAGGPLFGMFDGGVSFISPKGKFGVIEKVVPDLVRAELDGGKRPIDAGLRATKKNRSLQYASNKRLAKSAIKVIVAAAATAAAAPAAPSSSSSSSNNNPGTSAAVAAVALPPPPYELYSAASCVIDLRGLFKRGAGKVDDLADCMLQALSKL